MSVTTSFRPRDGQPQGEVADSRSEDVAAVVARAACATSEVAAAAPAARRRWLRAIALTLEEHVEELAELADAETALGLPRLTAEVGRAAAQLRFYGDVNEEGSYLGVAIDDATASSPRLVRVNQPLGPVAVFGASNFPLAFGVLGNDTASALAAGCPVVTKAHPAHPLLCARLAELATSALEDAGAPAGAFGMVTGFEAGAALVRAEGICAVGFTGSQRGGQALWRVANERDEVIPVYAEMGTVNPVVATPSATSRLAAVAEGFVSSFTLGAGQFCTKPGVLLAPAGHGAADAVADALRAAGPEPTMLTEAIASAATSGVDGLVEAGAEILARVPGPAGGWSTDAVVLTAPVAALEKGSLLLEECFGPVALVVEYADDAELDDVLEVLQGSLTGAVVTEGSDDDPHAARLVERLARKAGRVTIDDWPTGVAWTWAQQHGGPWPATSAPASTSVGAAALDRFVRPVAYQSVPDAWLPPAGRADNPWRVPRRINGRWELP